MYLKPVNYFFMYQMHDFFLFFPLSKMLTEKKKRGIFNIKIEDES